jgi:hypothetical protein
MVGDRWTAVHRTRLDIALHAILVWPFVLRQVARIRHVCTASRGGSVQGPQNGRMALHIVEYRLPQDASFSASCIVVSSSRLVVKNPHTAFKKFFLDIDTSLSVKSGT